MILRVVVAAVIIAGAGGVAWMLRRRRPAPPPRDSYPLPRQLDRDDFPRPDAPFLVTYFSSTTCDSCQGLGERVAALSGNDVATAEIEFHQRRDLHDRYEISAIPMILIADHEGVVKKGFVGSTTSEELTAALSALSDCS
jgi:Thioredoxin